MFPAPDPSLEDHALEDITRLTLTRFDKALKQRADEYDNATQIFYPNIPYPPLPATLPLANYTGTYFHPAYRNLTIYVKDDILHADRLDASWQIAVDFKHVSGDYFMAFADSVNAPGFIFKGALPAEFKVGSDGVSKSFGIALEGEMGLDARIWFERI